MPLRMEDIVSLCKRRGFIFPSSEIYGGFSSTWDYGLLGVELKRNVKEAWWKAVVPGKTRALCACLQISSGSSEGFSMRR